MENSSAEQLSWKHFRNDREKRHSNEKAIEVKRPGKDWLHDLSLFEISHVKEYQENKK